MLLRVVGLLRALLSADPTLSANPTTTVNINFSLWLCGAGGRAALLLRQVGGSIPRRYILSRFAHDLNCAHSSNCAHSLGTVRTIFWMCYYCCLHYTAFNGKSVFSHGASGSAFDSSTLRSCVQFTVCYLLASAATRRLELCAQFELCEQLKCAHSSRRLCQHCAHSSNLSWNIRYEAAPFPPRHLSVFSK